MEERATWQYDLLNACITSEVVQALPNQEKRAEIIQQLRATAQWYRRTRQHKLLWWTIELCNVVERSTTIHNARKELQSARVRHSGQITTTPASNTGVRSPEHQMLEDYIGGYNRG